MSCPHHPPRLTCLENTRILTSEKALVLDVSLIAHLDQPAVVKITFCWVVFVAICMACHNTLSPIRAAYVKRNKIFLNNICPTPTKLNQPAYVPKST